MHLWTQVHRSVSEFVLQISLGVYLKVELPSSMAASTPWGLAVVFSGMFKMLHAPSVCSFIVKHLFLHLYISFQIYSFNLPFTFLPPPLPLLLRQRSPRSRRASMSCHTQICQVSWWWMFTLCAIWDCELGVGLPVFLFLYLSWFGYRRYFSGKCLWVALLGHEAGTR